MVFEQVQASRHDCNFYSGYATTGETTTQMRGFFAVFGCVAVCCSYSEHFPCLPMHSFSCFVLVVVVVALVANSTAIALVCYYGSNTTAKRPRRHRRVKSGQNCIFDLAVVKYKKKLKFKNNM